MAIHEVYQTPAGMTDELRSHLRVEGNCILGTVNDDGSPHLTELLFMLDEQDRPLLPTPHTTRKYRNLLARPLATFFVSFRETSGWVSCTGPVELATGAEAERLNQSIRDHLLTDAGHATIGKLLGAHEDTTIIINPERWMSWNGSGLMERIVELGGDVEAHPASTWFKNLAGE
ncbi:MAG: pyridoxamine 5'-phosphate oxidase family protein [Acidimicrobiia bacterium]|nr:pyridoxamine 5'-phosphate oxidase family protein [Acidimicrobiia bacterium]MBT8193219.1 pyridoxamine 5'-phosphate oxidase family protein [Acidimicrobiia bacterium]NNF87907.1 pyridoxamine 5'-phosphate oxidase family protein [Acidimicrobiia bacterium]NNJ46361.1 pyridoxamine 5'-phosphate oxidase family protein [Acidimicrobiia bacterium]NNL98905.1 pyridoxamine 5'-phosphate oxidase family protein [Acidimicrobiia bacterium]